MKCKGCKKWKECKDGTVEWCKKCVKCKKTVILKNAKNIRRLWLSSCMQKADKK